MLKAAPLAAFFAFLLRWADAVGQSSDYVIPQEMGPLLVEMARVEEEPEGKDFKLKAVSIKVFSVTIVFEQKSGAEVSVELAHPQNGVGAVARTQKFAIFAKAVPAGLVAALERRIRAREAQFSWVRKIAPASVPVDPLNKPRFGLVGPAAELYQKGEKAIAAGQEKEAIGIALALVKAFENELEALRAAASLFRRAGKPREGAKVLEKASRAGEGAGLLDAKLEWLASLELFDEKQAEQARQSLAQEFSRVFPEPLCARYAALDLLLREGLAAQVAKLLGKGQPEPGQPACVYYFYLKLAMLSGEDSKVDLIAEAALSSYPEDAQIRFLWGTYYYKKGANTESLNKAIKAWEPLVRRDPQYPTLLGQFGTAMLVAGHLDREATQRLVRQAEETPNDAVTNYLAGLGLYYLRRYPEVIPFLERAVALVPEEPRARMYLAMAHFFSGRPDKAMQMLEELEPYTYQEPDINYCRSLVYRGHDLQRAIREMERFLEVFEGEHRLRFGEQKVQKARDDLQRMRRGEVPPVELPTPDIPSDMTAK